MHIWGKLESAHACQVEGPEKTEKTLSLHLRYPQHRHSLQLLKKQKQVPSPQQTPGKGNNLISRVTALLESNAQCSTKKNSQGI